MKEIPIRSRQFRQPPHQARLCGTLALLERDAPAAASRFRRWHGLSGKTYLVSVYPIEDCPDYVDAVVMAIDGMTGTNVWIGEAGGGGADFNAVLQVAALAGATEAHVHLLAGDKQAREAAIRDLDGRH
jgi:hypothetical protein